MIRSCWILALRAVLGPREFRTRINSDEISGRRRLRRYGRRHRCLRIDRHHDLEPMALRLTHVVVLTSPWAVVRQELEARHRPPLDHTLPPGFVHSDPKIPLLNHVVNKALSLSENQVRRGHGGAQTHRRSPAPPCECIAVQEWEAKQLPAEIGHG